MMLQATPKNIGWLLTALELAKRSLQGINVNHPTFVLLTKNEDDRFRVEGVLLSYFVTKYGVTACHQEVEPQFTGQFCSSFNFPTLGCRVLLMDVEFEGQEKT